MNVCLVGKYPPIEGGVSTETFWIARRLAERGHEVHVVTNAFEIEPAYRLELLPEDEPWWSGDVAGGARVEVHALASFDAKALSYVPQANPFVSRLAGLVADVVEAHDCEAIIAYYFEPYAVAGSLAAASTGRPLVVKHAGSDIDRLMQAPELAATYKGVLRSAEVVVTTPRLMTRFLGFGVGRERLVAAPVLPVPAELFFEAPAEEPLRPPAVGIYGKIGRSKGTFDLVSALGALAADGVDFELRAMIGEVQGEWLAPALDEASLSDRTRILPLVPHWRVPSFIRACTAVCFLERDFPVAIHGPMVPREVLACGVSLVVSGEIASKQGRGGSFESGENVVVIDDPKDHVALADALRPLLTDPGTAAAIGRRARELSQAIEPDDRFGAGWEAIALRAAGRSGRTELDAPAASDLIAPRLHAFVAAALPELSAALGDQPRDHEPFAVALAWCERVEHRLPDLPDLPEDDRRTLAEGLRYQRLRLECTGGASWTPWHAGESPLGTRGPDADRDGELAPVCFPGIVIETFEPEVANLLAPQGNGEPDALDTPLRVIFHQTPNLAGCELAVDEATLELLSLCDGSRSVDRIVGEMAEWFGVDEDPARDAVLGVLERLRAVGVIKLVVATPTADADLTLAAAR